MLIDASHPEETRVVVTRGNRIEEFDFESESKKQLKGNIYLARVTRVEPSLQAAFVEYGGNRHGFLAFSEIHPDYYQIPVADRQALLAAEAEEAQDEDDEEETEKPAATKRKRRRGSRNRAVAKTSDKDSDDGDGTPAGEEPALSANADESAAGEQPEIQTDETAGDAPQTENAASDLPDPDDLAADSAESDETPVELASGDEETTGENSEDGNEDDPRGPAMAAMVHADVISEPLPDEEEERQAEDGDAEVTVEAATVEETEEKPAPKKRTRRSTRAKRAKEPEPADDNGDDGEDGDDVESVGAEDALEELPSRKRQSRRQYKIQEVIKRRQILLVQVVKEERGNKGAALTTYLSLAGRYSVLMPNTARGGGISRKITNVQDRKRLKDVVKELDVPQGMGVILRTAGANRTKAEIKRDYEYLMRLWITIRDRTLESSAPALVHEEGSLIKRSVRDLYNKDINEILVAGDEGYREAKDFMRMLMPSHAKAVQPYKDRVPIFARNGIEGQLDSMLQPQVTLKSGGYIIINQTEALVAIDVNSGRSTREHSIEDTALRTNLEAADEVARQLRLRDLAGLIVIDFIDMEEKRNNRQVEKRLKECLKNDRARIQVGRISHFGLLEMSRQRIRASVLESTMQHCTTCHGTGYIRSESSVALYVVRSIEEYLLKDASHDIIVKTPTATALYVLNNKRANLADLEERFGLSIEVEADESLGSQHLQIVKGAQSDKSPAEGVAEAADDAAAEQFAVEPDEGADRNEESGKKRRRRRRRKSNKSGDTETREEAQADAKPDDAESRQDDANDAGDGDGNRKRRRGKRGGRRNRQSDVGETTVAEADQVQSDQAGLENTDDTHTESAEAPAQQDEDAAQPKPRTRRSRSRKNEAQPAEAEVVAAGAAEAEPIAADQNAAAPETAEEDAKPARRSRRKAAADAVTEEMPDLPAEPVVTSVVSEQSGEVANAEQPRKEGWWKRKGFF